MQPNIPLPTDNIYKFFGLFGLVMIISSMLAMVYFNTKYNELFAKDFLELQMLESKDNLSTDEAVRKRILELYMNYNTSDHIRFRYAFILSFILGLSLLIWGGVSWYHKVQPKQDELLNLQIEKMKREIQVLEKQLKKKETEEVPLS